MKHKKEFEYHKDLIYCKRHNTYGRKALEFGSFHPCPRCENIIMFKKMVEIGITREQIEFLRDHYLSIRWHFNNEKEWNNVALRYFGRKQKMRDKR